MIGQLSAELREGRGTAKARRLRRAGRIPALLYGEGRAPKHLSIAARDFVRLLMGQLAHVVDLTFEDEGASVTRQAQIKEVQYHPIHQDDVLHVDFHEIAEGRKIEVGIPLRATGTPIGLSDGGQFAMTMHELQVRCLPTAIPEEIVLDVSHLQLNQALHVHEVTLPDGVSAAIDADRVVANVMPPRGGLQEAEEEAPVEGSASEVEVIGADKEEEAPGG